MTRKFKILSDFDGVWTNQGPEAEVLMGWILHKLGELAAVGADRSAADLAAMRQQMRAATHRNGWAPDGRISAFVDEDPLVESSALCRFINAGTDAVTKTYRDAVLAAGFDNMAAFSEHAYVSATAAYRDSHPPCLVDNASEKLAALHETGADVVIISNSGADKIAAWFQAAGVDAGVEDTRLLRVRGSAAKWQLGPGDDQIEVAGRPIYVDRPKYRAAIEAESPDLIVGDVFSLDLALPHAMRTAGHAAAPQHLLLRKHAHTPTWVTQGNAGGAINAVIDGVEDIPAIVRAATGSG